jgi:heme exporter protein D
MESMSPPAQQFLSGALPIVVTLVISIWLASISQKKRLDDIARRARRLERMEARLDRKRQSNPIYEVRGKTAEVVR